MKNKHINSDNYQEGFFGDFGGQFVPKSLMIKLKELSDTYNQLKQTTSFQQRLQSLYQSYAGRPSLLYYAQNLTSYCGGAKIYLKREDLNHTGAHKINNTLGQALVAQKLGKTKIIAETGAGQHGVAVATVAAYFGLQSQIYMGERDVKNQKMNVYRMQLLDAQVCEVKAGQGTLKDAVDAALKAYIKQEDSYYMLGSAVGPHPYPTMVRDFQRVIGQEVRYQFENAEGRSPDYLVACVGGGSNALGLFSEFISDEEVSLIAVEPAGLGEATQHHGLSLLKGKSGVLHGFKCKLLQNEQGEVKESYSAASGLDYPGVSPELSNLYQEKRMQVKAVTDVQAVEAFQLLSRLEGVIPALESAHAVAAAVDLAGKLDKGKTIVINLSGRGDKDVKNVCENLITKV